MDKSQLPNSGVKNEMANIQAVDVYAQAEQNRILPRQMATGTLRGQQAVGDQGVLIDSVNQRISVANAGSASIDDAAVVFGKYNDDRYGQLFYDASGIPIILVGQHPVDGRMGMWTSKPGISVLDELAS